MDAKEFLRQVEKTEIMLRNKLIEQQQWRDIALGISATMDGDRVQSTGSKSKMSDAIDRCVDMEADIDAVVDKLVNVKKEVLKTIERLDSAVEYNILHMRYIQGKYLQEIADHYGREYGWVTTTHGRALKNVQALLDENL